MSKRSCGTKHYKLNDAQRALVEDNYGLVPYAVSRYFHVPQRDMEDVLQIGAIGLCRAAYEFDPHKQCSFSTFAIQCICSHIRHHFHVLFMDRRDIRREVLTMDDPIGSDSDSGCFADFLPDVTVNVEKEVYGRLETERLLRELRNVPLTEKERCVLTMHLAGETRAGIAQALGVSSSYIGQALMSARRKVRAWLEHSPKAEPMMRDNPDFPPLVVFVVYNPETQEYMTGRSNHNVYWSKDVQHAKRYRDKRCALNAVRYMAHDGNGKAEVRMLHSD